MDWGERLDRDLADSAAEGRRIRDVYTYNTSHGFVMYALCEDGTLWSRSPFAEDGNTGWDAVPPIPGSLQAIEENEKATMAREDVTARLHESDEAGKIEDTDVIVGFDTTYEHPEK